MNAEKYTRLISEIERACEGTAWEATLLRGRLEIRLTASEIERLAAAYLSATQLVQTLSRILETCGF